MMTRKLKIFLLLSLSMNVVFMSVFAYKLHNNWFEMSVLKSPFRTSLFSVAPKQPGKIYFVGDSHTEAFELNELLGHDDVRNRGVWGDRTSNVLKRMVNVLKARPKKIFLMIGVNDICAGASASDIASNVEQMIRTAKDSVPGVQFYVQSILPTDHKIIHSGDNAIAMIRQVNAMYVDICKKYNATYIDLFPHFLSGEGLKPEYSFDGLHLNGSGYLELARLLKPYVDSK